MRSTACMVVCTPPTASVFFCQRTLGSCHSHFRLSGRRKPLKATHGTATAMQQSKSWAFPLLLGSIAQLPLRLADRAGGEINICACDWHIVFWGGTAGVRCAMFYSRGHGCCPGHHPLRYTIYRLVGGRRWCPNSDGLPRGRWPSGNMPYKLDKLPHIQSIRFDLLRKKSLRTYFSVRWIDLPSIFLAPSSECLLGDAFFDQSITQNVKSTKRYSILILVDSIWKLSFVNMSPYNWQ